MKLNRDNFSDLAGFNEFIEDQLRLFRIYVRPVSVIPQADGKLLIYFTEEIV